ncbi:unnamed protein product [Dibothriocephalus latus]|uniref:Uncharacterized protein n=1 Tax=Dibothriocephalus latus TaxID=60516 RepID=A0A3P7QRV1_DIBLA|nr:unnamed protein product [Dibothriocephalus latus]
MAARAIKVISRGSNCHVNEAITAWIAERAQSYQDSNKVALFLRPFFFWIDKKLLELFNEGFQKFSQALTEDVNSDSDAEEEQEEEETGAEPIPERFSASSSASTSSEDSADSAVDDDLIWVFRLPPQPKQQPVGVSSSQPSQYQSIPPITSACMRCRQVLGLIFEAQLAHSFSSVVGNFCVANCTIMDVQAESAEVTVHCTKCSSNLKIVVSSAMSLHLPVFSHQFLHACLLSCCGIW